MTSMSRHQVLIEENVTYITLQTFRFFNCVGIIHNICMILCGIYCLMYCFKYLIKHCVIRQTSVI